MPTIQASGGILLHVQFTPPRSSQDPCLLWLHGAFEHSGHYEKACSYFAKLGWGNIIFDLRGHGKSGGTRVFITNFEEYLEDVNIVYETFAKQLEGPLILIGHSMGGLIAIRYLEWDKAIAPFQHCIVTAPFLGLAIEIPAWKKFLSKLIVRYWPKFSLPNGLDPRWLSHDIKYVQFYQNDPLVVKKATAAWFEQILLNHKLAFQKAPTIDTPLDIFIAADDKIVSNNTIELFFENLPPTLLKSKHFLPDFYHEVFNESNASILLHEIESIIKARTKV
ncbi:MAG: alpha/beta hydrolase [Bacteroidia bacterium]|nr:lysophospholipase [Bacteroidia bacterium]MDW8159530.1 alpha/beta hydrolase [Bacteroidia bacterium]